MPNDLKQREAGQTLVELLVVIAVGVMIISALVFATISSIRNAELAKNQTQATKWGQDGIERLLSLRDRNGAVSYSYENASGNLATISNFKQIWPLSFACPPANTNCYFNLSSNSSGEVELRSSAETKYEELEGSFFRQVRLSKEANSEVLQATVIVKWSDFAGDHESKLATILRRTDED